MAARASSTIPPAARYQVGEKLATGGMGTVYRGYDQVAQRPIAYKRIRIKAESARARMTALFQREYDTLANLAHPNIVEVYDSGIDAFGPYYTMELLSGDDLANLAPLPLREGCRVLRDVASALALLHARRLVHRDVSPNNIRLTVDGRAKLIDFGGLTGFGSPSELVGTPVFIAPECLGDTALDGRTDLYALGALAYWTLTRRTHLRARTLEELVEAWSTPLVPPSQYAPDMPKELDELILSLLHHEPMARPSSAAHVIERLTTLADLAPQPDEARVAYSYLQRAPLRGREQASSTIRAALRAASAGTGQVVVVQAEQGLGRSALLEHVAVEAQLTGATVLRAQGGMHQAPFSAARYLVETALGMLPEVARRSRASQLFEPRRGATAPTSIDASERQAKITATLQDSLLELSLLNPLVLLIDDAHIVDAESLALFASMLDVLRGYALLIVLSVSAREPTRHPQAFAKLEASATHCTLPALSAQQTMALVGTMFGGVPNSQILAAWLYEQTGGNPAQCMDLTHWLLTGGVIRYTLGTFTLPHTLEPISTSDGQARIRAARLASLTPTAARVAYLLGIHGGPLTTTQIVDASELASRDVLLASEELVQRGIAVSHGETISCASEALRSALRSGRSAQEAHDAHHALARAFLRLDLNVLEHRLAAAQHLLSAGGEEAFRGACLLARTSEEHRVALAMARPTVALMQKALEVLEARGYSDEQCIGLLVPLSAAGFYGELEAQRRYFERTMVALSAIAGITLAARLRRWVGPQLGLVVGILAGLFVFLFRSRRVNRRSFSQHLQAFGSLPGAAGAASACTWDVTDCYRIADWLEPFVHAAARSPLRIMRNFCMANAELVAVKLAEATAAYAQVRAVFDKPVLGFTPDQAESFRCGCLHGEAQALVTDCAPAALALADELQQRSTFFAPHAEGIRMTYHAYRGEARQAAVHRERAEALAFRGGTSWSATCLLVLRAIQACVTTGDVVGLVHVIADLERLKDLSASVKALYELAQGHLELLRGHPARAITIYERVFATEVALTLPTYPVERALHAQALAAQGDFAAARDLCLQVMQEVEATGRDSEHIFLSTRQQLALAEAELGNHTHAVELIDSCFERARRHDNPRSLGGVHRVRAYVAALAGDRATFAEHFAAMSTYFRATENSWLIQQCDALLAQAVRLGVANASTTSAREAEDLDGATEVKVGCGT